MNAYQLTPELYTQLINEGYRYLALSAVRNHQQTAGSDFVFIPLREMPSSFSQSLTSINDFMIRELVFGKVENIHIQVMPETPVAYAA